MNEFKYCSILLRMSKNVPEPLLEDNPNRYVMFPIKDHDIWHLYKKMLIVCGELKRLIYRKIWFIGRS